MIPPDTMRLGYTTDWTGVRVSFGTSKPNTNYSVFRHVVHSDDMRRKMSTSGMHGMQKS